VAGQLEDPRVVANELSVALEHDRLEIVVEKLSRRAAKRFEGSNVSAKEALERLVEGEAREESARERQDHHEARQLAIGAANADRAEAGPIDLALLARQRVQSKERLARAAWTDGFHEATDLLRASRKPARLEHLEQPCCAKTRMLLECFKDQGLVRVETRRPLGSPDGNESIRLDRQSDGVVMHPQLGGDRADLPVLGEV
jgi:hypothetical protein